VNHPIGAHGQTYGTVAGGGPPAVRRPATLTAAVWMAAIVGLLYIVGAAMIMVSGKDAIRAYLTDETEASDELVDAIAAAAIDEAYSSLVVKAVVAVVVAIAILAAALFARTGATWARIVLAVSLAVAACAGAGLQIGDADVLPNASFAAAALAPPLSIAVIVLLFLPASNRYARSRRGVTA
jgi:hypothetical protein